ncbi:MAG: hypothetical protein OQK75_10725 [Gammaproteobacteria bacterium]|nr:hypothetical protein [Gammaproteobacteria bacterium]MCW8988124.1 hypothetical protein [Gammaproteobacteria bacterium]MCW9030515.1 hypothetical protein [Gammaproteobacteria bacterium]
MILVNDINAHLEPYFKTGTEGIIWSVQIDILGYEGLYKLKDGDELIIYTKNRCAICWKGIVQLEYKRLYTPYPENPQYGQQLIFNRWVHGFQDSLQPHIWAKWFFEKMPASLLINDSKR